MSLNSTTTEIVQIANINATTSIKYADTDYDDTLQIVLPFISGLFVALCLAWMLIRYKATKYQRNHSSESIYCCPESCFNTIANLSKNRVSPELMSDKHSQPPSGTNMNNRASLVSLISNGDMNSNSRHQSVLALQRMKRSTITEEINERDDGVARGHFPMRTFRNSIVALPSNKRNSILMNKFDPGGYGSRNSVSGVGSGGVFKSFFHSFQRQSPTDFA